MDESCRASVLPGWKDGFVYMDQTKVTKVNKVNKVNKVTIVNKVTKVTKVTKVNNYILAARAEMKPKSNGFI